MKKIFKLRVVLLFLAMSLQFSCSDWLELLPNNGLVREEYWKTKSDVEGVLMGAYQKMASLDGSLFTYGEARGDMVEAHNEWSGDELKLMESNITSDNSLCNWASFYTAINYCNEVIKNAPGVQEIDNTFTDFQLQSFLAEAHFVRSLSYFYLVRIFKDVPLVLEPSETDNSDFYLPKSDGDSILVEMLEYLNEYRKYASDEYTTTEEEKGRATKSSFDALIADICLWRFDYDGCITACDNIMANTKYVLLSGTVWFELFYPGNSLEGIFEIQYSDQDNETNSTYGITNQNAHKYLPSQTAIELFAKKYTVEGTRGEDASIAKVSEDNYIIWKYVGSSPDSKTVRSSDIQNSCNWIVYRLADIYLMKAEALSQVGRYTDAADLLNEIRDRANMSTLAIGNSADAYEDAIMDERAVELAFEGKRWFDLLRMGRRNNYKRKSKLIDLIVANVPSTQKRILSARLTNPLGWYLPIAKSEMERNKNLVQNTYYTY